MNATALAARRPRVWIAAAPVSLAGAGVAVLAARAEPGETTTLPLAFAIALIALATLLRPIEPAPGEKFSLAGAVAFFAALVLPAAQAIVAIAVASLAARAVRRTSLVSTSVNLSKSIGAVGAAAGVVQLDGARPPSLDEALLAGMLYVAITLAPVAAMVGWTHGRAAVGGFLAREWLPTVTLVAIGALAAAIWTTTPFLIALLAFPLAMVEIAARSSSRARVAEQGLVRALEAQRVFAADAAHELRNPLAAIRGNIAYVEPERLPQDQAEALVQAKDDSASLSALVERLLLLAKTDRPAGGTSNVAEAVARAIATVRPRETVALEVNVPGDLEVAVGRELMDALVRDVTENAAAYTERGHIAVTAERRAKSAILMIDDTGVGIAPDELPRVFDRFFRGSSARKLARGSGLGLAIARRIAEAYGGDLVIESAPGRGTRVTVTLPLAR